MENLFETLANITNPNNGLVIKNVQFIKNFGINHNTNF